MGMGQIVDYSQFILQIEKAIANGVASLDSNAKVPKNQISLNASDVGAIATGGTAGTANQLTAPRTISTTGDATYSVSFDGSANVSSAITLANSGVTTGTYNALATQVRPFTVDAKGRITGVGTPVDITPPWSAVTGKPTTLNGYGITDALNLAGGNVTGNLGLGVSLPTVKLSIGRLGGAFSVPTLNANTTALITAGGAAAASGAFLSMLGGNTSQVAVTFGDSDAAEQGGIYYNNSTDTLDLRAGNLTRISISGTTTFSSTTTSTSTTTGAICAASLGITGAIFAGSLNGNGSGLTSLNASNISVGTLNAARLPDTYLPLAGGTLTGTLGIKERSANAAIAINSEISLGSDGTRYGIFNRINITNEVLTTSRISYGNFNQINSSDRNSSSFSLALYGAWNDAITTASGGSSNSTLNVLYGAFNRALHQGSDATFKHVATTYGAYNISQTSGSTATITTAVGSFNYVLNSNATSTITTAHGTQSVITANPAGSLISTGYLFRGEYGGSGTITNRYGLYIDNLCTSYLLNLQIGGTVPSGGGTAGLGVGLPATGSGNIDASGKVTASSFSVGNNQVVSGRRTGWAAPTGTATRTTFATETVTLPQLAERVKGLIDDLTTHGLIGA